MNDLNNWTQEDEVIPALTLEEYRDAWLAAAAEDNVPLEQHELDYDPEAPTVEDMIEFYHDLFGERIITEG